MAVYIQVENTKINLHNVLPEHLYILLKFPLHRICVIVKSRVVHAISTQNIYLIDVQDLLCVFVFCLRLLMKESKNRLYCK